MVEEQDERCAFKASDSIDEQSPTKKRKQEVGGKSNGKQQANATISENSLPFQEKGTLGISMKLAPGASKKQKTESPRLQKKPGSTASVFNESDEEEEEEDMPREARMRMRNLGKETPTSAGPNSFNKGRKGFTHHQKVWEKTMKLQPVGISMKLAPGASKKQKTESPLQKKTGSAASAFNESDEEEEEEDMPREARMRMRNLGKETPTSAGPNSFNKGRKGFTHHQKVWEKTTKLQPTDTSKKETE